MKLNLPSTLINPKISSLLLLTLLHLPESEAGNGFRNCLRSQYFDISSYDALMKFSFSANNNLNTKNIVNLCCDKVSCRECANLSTDYISCRKNPDGNVFCAINLCNGLIGNGLITSDYIDPLNPVIDSYCAKGNIDKVRSFLATIPTSSLTWLDRGYAEQSCSNPDVNGCFGKCNWDNGGWTCSHDSSKGIFYLQFPAPWPGPADKNPITYIYTPTTTSTIAPTSPLPTSDETTLPETNNHLLEKIAIPVGTVSGTGLLTGLTYYYCKKRKNKRKSLVLNETESSQAALNNLKEETEEIELSELTEKELSEIKEAVETHKVEVEEFQEENNELITFTPPHSPQPSQSLNPQTLNQPLTAKEILIKELQDKLTDQEQLWTDYCEVNQLLIDKPNSQFIINSFNNLHQQLLQILTLGEITLLLENQSVNNQVGSPQNEYSQFIEVVRSPQIRYGSPQQWN